jgi:hypothetical protein
MAGWNAPQHYLSCSHPTGVLAVIFIERRALLLGCNNVVQHGIAYQFCTAFKPRAPIILYF